MGCFTRDFAVTGRPGCSRRRQITGVPATRPGPAEEPVRQTGRPGVPVELGELLSRLVHQRSQVDQQRRPVVAVLDQQREARGRAGPLRAAGPAAPEGPHGYVRSGRPAHAHVPRRPPGDGPSLRRQPPARQRCAGVRLPARPGSMVGRTWVGAVSHPALVRGARDGGGGTGSRRQKRTCTAGAPSGVDGRAAPTPLAGRPAVPPTVRATPAVPLTGSVPRVAGRAHPVAVGSADVRDVPVWRLE